MSVLMRKPSDNGLQCVADMVGVWDKLAIALGVPMVKIKEYRHQSLSSITSLLYWRNGSTGNPVTWKFLLDKVQGIPDLGQPMAEDIEKGITANPDWTDSGSNPQQVTIKPSFMNKSPTDAGLQGIVSDPNIGGFWTQLATAVGVPAPFIKRCEQNPTPGVTALRYWVNGNVDDVDTTWEFLLDTMREDPNLGKDVVDKLEKKIEGHRHWTQW
jgi:hypothetical protein